MNTTVQYDKVICDNGTGYLKVGFAGDNFPRHHVPSVVGRPMLRSNQSIGDKMLKEVMIGDEVGPYRAMLDVAYPITEGKVKNWEDFNLLWQYTFQKKMGIKDFPNSRLLVTEAAMNTIQNREKMAELIFESHNFGHCMFQTQAVLSLMSEGLSTGIVMDSGDGVSHVIPVVEGYLQQHSVKRLDMAGRHVTQYLVKLLTQAGYAFNSSADFETVREIKEQCCFVSYDPSKDLKLANETTILDKEYTLPDKSVIKISRERYQAAECLFNPFLAGKEDSGIAQKLFDSLQTVDIDNFVSLAQNIYLTGGTTMFAGLSTRMYNELEQIMVEQKYKGKKKSFEALGLRVHDPPRRKHSVFIGASFLAANEEDDKWISKARWAEEGARAVR